MSEALVLIPGRMCDARIFGPQIADLSRDHPVMCAPPVQGERIEEIASHLLDALPTRFALSGLSMGGFVAMEILRRAPDRVTRLCLMGTSPLAETPQQAAERDPQLVRVKAGRLREVMWDEVLPRYVATQGSYRQEILQLALDMAEVLGPEVFARQTRAIQRRRDQQVTMRRITVPTLILCGDQDLIFPIKRHSFLAELIPNAHLEVIEGAGHLLPLEAPEAVSDNLRDWMNAPLVLR